jgi:hypothetical protein
VGGYENFLKRMNAGGKTMREEQIENALHLVRQTFADDPSYIVDGVTVWNTNRLIHPRIYSDKYRSTSPAQASIQTMINEPFYMGDVIPWPDHGYWLCVNANNLHGIQWEGTLSFCNHKVKFFSPLNGELVEYPISVLNATQYGSGQTDKWDDELRMTIGTSQQIVYISFDKHTVLLDSGFRFLLDRNQTLPTAYQITQADTISYSDGGDKGYIQLTVIEDQYNPKTDNKELMIANYTPDPVGTGEELKDTDKSDQWI